MANWLRSLFNPTPTVGDFSSLKVDLHSHLIPGIDDGVQTMDESIYFIRELKRLGFEKIITTPHIMPGYFDNTPAIIKAGLENVRNELKAQNIDVQLEAATEYYFDEYLFEELDNQPLTFSDNYLLFELPSFNMPPMVKEFVFEANSKRVKPMLAHVERYPFMHDDYLKQYEELYNMELYMQVNIGSLVGAYGEQVQKIAFKLIENGFVDFLGSDLHGEKHLHMLEVALRDKHVLKVLETRTFKNIEL
jgi:tyrosine-protein phosphatase YwqE